MKVICNQGDQCSEPVCIWRKPHEPRGERSVKGLPMTCDLSGLYIRFIPLDETSDERVDG